MRERTEDRTTEVKRRQRRWRPREKDARDGRARGMVEWARRRDGRELRSGGREDSVRRRRGGRKGRQRWKRRARRRARDGLGRLGDDGCAQRWPVRWRRAVLIGWIGRLNRYTWRLWL